MPRRLPPDQISWRAAQYSLPNPDAGQHASNILKKDAATSTVQEIDRIEPRYWHNRIISLCKRGISRVIHPPPSIKLNELVNDLTKYSQRGDQQKVLVALKLHIGQAIRLHQSKDGTLGFTNENISVSTKTMEAVVQSIKQSSVEVAYAYLRKGKQLPEGYLRQLILPHIIQTTHDTLQYEKASKLPVTQQQLWGRHEFRATPEQYILDLLQTAGIKDEKSFTFERMLEFKKDLRNNIALSIEEQRLATRLQISSSNNGASAHRLTEPKKTDHFIEKEDIQHIQELSLIHI